MEDCVVIRGQIFAGVFVRIVDLSHNKTIPSRSSALHHGKLLQKALL